MIDADRRARYESYAHTVWVPLQSYVRRRAQPSDVDDVVAETLAVGWRRLDDLPADASPAHAIAWTLAVARRTLANHRRSERRRGALVARIGAQPATPADAVDTDPALDAALAMLDADDREIVRLWAWEQLEPRDIAVVLGVMPNTAAARLSRAKRRLANLLTRHDPVVAGQEEGGATMGPQP